MRLDSNAILVDVAFAVCTALDRAGMIAVLTGGSAATYYATDRYQSLDADFVFQCIPQQGVLDKALLPLGYTLTPSGMYEHPQIRFTVEFPRGPLSIGRSIVTTWATERRGSELLHITSVTDCVRDRFMHFWAWNDRSALETALTVVALNGSSFDSSAFLRWTRAEQAADRSYEQEKVDEFMRRLAR